MGDFRWENEFFIYKDIKSAPGLLIICSFQKKKHEIYLPIVVIVHEVKIYFSEFVSKYFIKLWIGTLYHIHLKYQSCYYFFVESAMSQIWDYLRWIEHHLYFPSWIILKKEIYLSIRSHSFPSFSSLCIWEHVRLMKYR